MAATTIDPNFLRPSGEIGRAEDQHEFNDAAIAAINDHASLIDTRQGLSNIYNILDYGSVTTPDLTVAALEAAGDAASTAGGGMVYLPAGTYQLPRDITGFWCFDWQWSNVGLVGDRGQSILQAVTGLPDVSISILRVNNKTDILFKDIIFDGNWGNAVTYLAPSTVPVALPQGTLTVESTTGFPTSGTFTLDIPGGTAETITYTGKTATTFTGCSGGTAVIKAGYACGLVNSQAGINHTTQVDPKNYEVMLRGAHRVRFDGCTFRQAYGDGIWMGQDVDSLVNQTSDVKIVDCVFDTNARNGISFGAGASRVDIVRCSFRNIFTTAIDIEGPGLDQKIETVHIRDCYIGGWFNPPGGSFDNVMSIVGGAPLGDSVSGSARDIRISGCKIFGSTLISTVRDIVFRDNNVISNWSGANAIAPVFIDHSGQAITIADNTIYDNTTRNTPGQWAHVAALHVNFYGATAITDLQPSVLAIRGNNIYARNGNDGILLFGPGGFGAGDTNPERAPVTATATSVTQNTLTKAAAGWTVNQWATWTVRLSTGQVALIESNTATVLTLVQPGANANAWMDAFGNQAPAPTGTPVYTITSVSGICDVSDNNIDCGADGNSAGRYGIWCVNDRAGSRIRLSNNKIKNATSWGILVAGAASDAIRSMEIIDNKVWDDQATPTTSAAIRFEDAASLTSIPKLVMRGNSLLGGVSTLLSNVSTHYWLVNDGDTQQWAGYGSPNGVITAPLGSTYQRKDGGAGTSFYVNEDGTTTWAAK